MTEKQLISKIKKLRNIKPDQDWVVFTKDNIMGKEKKFSFSALVNDFYKGERFVFNHKPAFAFLTVLLIVIGLFGFSQNSVPGDSLFTLKKITEKGQGVLEKDEVKRNLALVDKRLDDLAKIAEDNDVNKLAPAINEYQETVSNVADSLEDNPKNIQEIVGTIKELEGKQEKIKSLGIEIGDNEKLDNVLGQIVQNEINDLETKILSEEQEQELNQAKELFEQEEYSEALEKILTLY